MDSDHDRVEDDPLGPVTSLAEPTRRALYGHVARSSGPVGRDAAAAALGISRSLAAFHLDRLAEDGLLDVEYRRLTGRSGPGAGRPAKLYRRAARQVDISLPPRRYALAASVLADAVDGTTSPAVRASVASAARERGRELARGGSVRLTKRASRKQRLEALTGVLVAAGFEPYVEGREVRVRNCPFHPLASVHVDLVCGMSRELAAGAAEQLGLDLPMRLDPRPGECCVVISR